MIKRADFFKFSSFFKRAFFILLSFSCLAVGSKQFNGLANDMALDFIMAEGVKNKKQRVHVKAPFLTLAKKEESIDVLPKAGSKEKRGANPFRVSKSVQDEERKARGVVIRYHKWPSLKRQREVERILRSSDLKRTKSIKEFRAQLFGWTKGGLKPSSLGEKACDKLKGLSYVRRCSPDHLLPLNESKRISQGSQPAREINESDKKNLTKETEGSFNFECENCKKEELKALKKVSQKVLNLRTCNIVSHNRGLMMYFKKGGMLSDYWAQELIGSDLMREELEKTSPPEIENFIAVFDGKKGDHNIGVKNLISDEGTHAVLPELGERNSFLDTKPEGMSIRDYREGKGYKPALSLYETGYPGDYLFALKKSPPSYINNSQSWLNSADIYDVFKRLSSSQTSHPIVVVPSGNDFPKRLDNMQNKASKNFDVIVVGSFAPDGFVSEFSQSGKEVSVLAPSDSWITSAGGQWDKKQFGGTSGAAPLVTGSLAGFEWLSGYHPTAKEAKILLEKTALPTLHSFEKPRINGAGLLNSYKLGEVAKRLKEKCKDNLFCFKEEIVKDENYRFAKDKNLKRDLRRVFPSCSGGDSAESSSGCEEKKELFKRLRKEILLNPTEEYYKNLSCLYKEADFVKNAEGLDNMALALGGTELEVREILKKQTRWRKINMYMMQWIRLLR